jgi:hypothetical protein
MASSAAGSASGLAVSQHACSWALRINPGGKFTGYWALADDQDAVNAFWS